MHSEGHFDFSTLKLERLEERHQLAFSNSLPKYTKSYAYEQEKRQTVLKDKFVTIRVQVAREDFPGIAEDVELTYLPSAAQAAWKYFLQEIRKKLKIEFVDSIFDKYDKSPIHRVLRLVDGASYLVRQREESSVLEVIYTGNTPTQISWPITQVINAAKLSLSNGLMAQTVLNKKVDRLISLPIARVQEREASKDILQSITPYQVISIVENVMTSIDAPPETEEEKEAREYEEKKRIRALEIMNNNEPSDVENGATTTSANMNETLATTALRKTYDKEVDVVSLHRLAFESIHRMIWNKIIDVDEMTNNNNNISFIKNTIDKFINEADIVVFGLNLIAEIIPHLTRNKFEILTTIMNCIQAHAPDPPPNRPRKPRRLQPSQQELAAQRIEQEALKLAELMLKEEEEAILLQQKREKEMAASRPPRGRQTTTNAMDPLEGLEQQLQQQQQQQQHDEDGYSTSSGSRPGTGPGSRGSTPGSRKRRQLLQIPDRHQPLPEITSKAHKRVWKGGSTALRRASKAVEKKKDKVDFTPNTVQYDDTVQPLPVVPGLKFRGLKIHSGDLKLTGKDLGFSKGFSTLFSFIDAHPSNVEVAIRYFVHEEIADIALVCQTYPRILEYVIWSLDAIFRYTANDKALEELEAEDNDDGDEDIFSASFTSTQSRREEGGRRGKSSPPMQMSSRPRSHTSSTSSSIAIQDVGSIEGLISIDGDSAGSISMERENDSTYNSLGRPVDHVVYCLAMISRHSEVADRDRATARKWLRYWDDGTRAFHRLRMKGINMAGL